MDQRAFTAVAMMFNAFPTGSEDTELRLKTVDAMTADFPSEAVYRAAKKFTAGKVHDQSLRFAPSVPEFVREVESQAAIIRMESRPRLASPPPKPGGVRVKPEAMQALADALAGKRSIESVADEFIKQRSE